MTNRDESILGSSIRFYNRYELPLDAGDYSISVTQDVKSTDQALPLTQSFSATQNFSVIAPRFSLPSTDVQSVFPPANATGAFDQNLPHIILSQRGLPWERELAHSGLPTTSNTSINAFPWLALLLFTVDEIIPPKGNPSVNPLANPTLVATYAVDDVLIPPDSQILGSGVSRQREDETTCLAIDITTNTFTKVTPRLQELPYLTHVRQVNVDDKITDLAISNGWFSVVIGNRFPAEPSADGTRYIAHLVSLEGFAPYLVDSPSWPGGKTKVRLVSLFSWSFTCLADGGNFRQLMLNLIDNQPKGGDKLRLRLPVTNDPQQKSSPADLVQKTLQQGYAALEYETRVGDQTFAWYHGPLVPHPLKILRDKSSPFRSSAEATIYDPTTGTFDLSYAVAWELGRLLALSDRAYSTNQLRSQKELRRVMNLVRERSRCQSGQNLLAKNAITGNVIALTEILESKHVSRAFVDWLGNEFGSHLPRSGSAAIATRPANPHAPLSSRSAPATSQFRTLFDRDDIQSLIAQHVNAVIQDNPLSDVVDWLGKLRLLYGVPFIHLVSDSRMLPSEEIRFFYVDSNYLDALSDGASSVSIQSSRDVEEQQLVHHVIRTAAIEQAHAFRANQIGRPMLLRDMSPNDSVAGFILRSAVVSGWPGLEVKAFESVNGITSPLSLIRMDRLAPDVLLCLFSKVPAWIEFNEPREGLAFGIGDSNAVELRYIDGADIGKVIPNSSVILDVTYRRGTTGVININEWQGYLRSQLPSSRLWGPAAFAIQMVRAPAQIIFMNQPDSAITTSAQEMV